MLIRKYTPDDYVGECNIKRHEKELILKAYVRHMGNRCSMAKSLQFDEKTLYNKILSHGLEEVFSSSKSNELIINLLQELGFSNT